MQDDFQKKAIPVQQVSDSPAFGVDALQALTLGQPVTLISLPQDVLAQISLRNFFERVLQPDTIKDAVLSDNQGSDTRESIIPDSSIGLPFGVNLAKNLAHLVGQSLKELFNDNKKAEEDYMSGLRENLKSSLNSMDARPRIQHLNDIIKAEMASGSVVVLCLDETIREQNPGKSVFVPSDMPRNFCDDLAAVRRLGRTFVRVYADDQETIKKVLELGLAEPANIHSLVLPKAAGQAPQPIR